MSKISKVVKDKSESILKKLGFSFKEKINDGYFDNTEIIYTLKYYFVSLAVKRGEFEIRFGYENESIVKSWNFILIKEFFHENWKEIAKVVFSGREIHDDEYVVMLEYYCQKIICYFDDRDVDEVIKELDKFCYEVSMYNMNILKER